MRNVTFPHPKWDKNNLVQNIGNVLNMAPSAKLSLVRRPQAGKSSQTDLADEIKIVLGHFYTRNDKQQRHDLEIITNKRINNTEARNTTLILISNSSAMGCNRLTSVYIHIDQNEQI